MFLVPASRRFRTETIERKRLARLAAFNLAIEQPAKALNPTATARLLNRCGCDGELALGAGAKTPSGQNDVIQAAPRQ